MVEKAAKRKTSQTCLAVLLSLIVLAAVTPTPADALAITLSTDNFATASTSVYLETRDRVSNTLASTHDQLSSALSQDLRIGYEQPCATEVVESLAAPGRGVSKGRAIKEASISREKLTEIELRQQCPDAEIQAEHYLRDSAGAWLKDPVTGIRRRVDHAVIRDGRVIDLVETTSLKANKTAQIAQEAGVRAAGGNFIRRRNPREVIPIADGVTTRIVRKK